MLDGIWPGRDDTMAVQRYVAMHFSDDWTTYLYFAQWGDAQIAANPQTIVRLEDWLLVSEEDGGGRIKGEGLLQSPRLVLILAGAVCVVWEFAPVQIYACVGLYRISTVSLSWLARKHKKPKNSLFSGYKKNSYCHTSQ